MIVNPHKSALMFRLDRLADGPMSAGLALQWAGLCVVGGACCSPGSGSRASRLVLKESSRRAKLRVSWNSSLIVYVDYTFRLKRSEEWIINDFKRMHCWDQSFFFSHGRIVDARTHTDAHIAGLCFSRFEQNLNL